MKPNKAITIDGRNLLSSPEAIDKLRSIKKEDEDEHGWSRKYSFSNI